MRKLPELKTWLRWQLRKISLRWPARSQAMARARVERGVYRCEGCGALTPAKNIQADHIIPVVGPNGFTNWDDFIQRLFCSVENYQILCKKCHDVKTLAENKERRDGDVTSKPKRSDVVKKKAIKRKKIRR